MEKTENNQSWFFETSLFINHFFGHPLLKRYIKSTIGSIPCYTSYFVFYEFKRCVIKTLINFYFTVLEENSPSDALAYYMSNFKTRENKIILAAISNLLSESDLSNNKSKLLKNLKMLICLSLQKFNDSIYGFVENHSKCPLAKVSLNNDNEFEEFCEQINCKTKCSIADFWKENRKVLRLLTNDKIVSSHKHNKGFYDQVEILREVLNNFERGQMIRNCQKIADTLIAIEMPKIKQC